MRRAGVISRLFILAISVALAFFICPASYASEGSAGGETTSIQLTHDGIDRDFYLHLPAGFEKNQPSPVVFVLHGGGGSADRMLTRQARDFISLSDREGFILVYPNGYPDQTGSARHHWNDGRKKSRWRAHRLDIDDVGFFSAMIDLLIKEYNADPKRIYATGISNGGLMSYRLACELSDRIAAVAAVTANLTPEISRFPSKGPISILIMNGTEDPLMIYEGGEITFREMRLGKILSTAETVKFWLDRNQCQAKPQITREPDLDPQDGTRVSREAYGPCKEGTEVILYTIEGGGHTWPGGVQYLHERLIGKVSRDIDADKVIWEFFKRHRRN
ncbi:MAG: hypothetical protein JRG97_15750 [Deltaproteobacteria bacterium]|nr:hypothetical protein [Deltaproteobacteria bacterium]MBW2053820.1 hypothetical protein [Deltaproteobacteria bacterium]MBW2142486.1 hypothetical protein [Deltaproteobacteria bacterium]